QVAVPLTFIGDAILIAVERCPHQLVGKDGERFPLECEEIGVLIAVQVAGEQQVRMALQIKGETRLKIAVSLVEEDQELRAVLGCFRQIQVLVPVQILEDQAAQDVDRKGRRSQEGSCAGIEEERQL